MRYRASLKRGAKFVIALSLIGATLSWCFMVMGWSRLSVEDRAMLLIVGLLSFLVVIVTDELGRPARLPGQCMSCGYNLTGNVSGRCSECGTAI
jgi:hypothetical protein